MNINPLSGKDIKMYMNDNCLILPYLQLQNYNNIDDIFNINKYVFILYPIGDNFGHWVLLMDRGNNIEVFDSYGIYPDMEYKHGTDKTPKYLSRLLINSNKSKKLYYNEIQFQEWNTNYCGYYCIYRALNSKLSLKQFQDMLLDVSDPSKYIYNKLLY